MLKKIPIVWLLFLNILAYPVDLQLSTIVDNQELIPVIKLNGDIVIKIRDVGTKQVFSSAFERSENIFSSLKEAGETKANLSRIRIRRNKADYVAYIDNIEIFRATPSDVIGSDLTVYQMASLWRENIENALNKPSFNANSYTSSDNQSSGNTPLISFLSIFSNNSVFIMLVQMAAFVLIQVIAIAFTFQYLNRRYALITDDFHRRLKKFHHEQIRMKSLLASLDQHVQDSTKKKETSHQQPS
ncbi:MAG: hypothetical protein ISQ13_04990 [Candidatus Margulisbacteria bacterium]|nr:hypothetical protein [Candidatus Margulisiibacteriota bacterium]